MGNIYNLKFNRNTTGTARSSLLSAGRSILGRDAKASGRGIIPNTPKSYRACFRLIYQFIDACGVGVDRQGDKFPIIWVKQSVFGNSRQVSAYDIIIRPERAKEQIWQAA